MNDAAVDNGPSDVDFESALCPAEFAGEITGERIAVGASADAADDAGPVPAEVPIAPAASADVVGVVAPGMAPCSSCSICVTSLNSLNCASWLTN